MNQFQKEVLSNHPDFEYHDFIYFTGEVEEKVKAMELPKEDCKINAVFVGCNHMLYHQREYCFKNCGFKCLNGEEYKRIK